MNNVHLLFRNNQFWRQTEQVDILLFFAVLLVALLLLVLLKWWTDRRQEEKDANEFLDQARSLGFTAEEYEYAVDLVNDHHVVPAMRLLLSLRHYDGVASHEVETLLNKELANDDQTVQKKIQLLYEMRRKLAIAQREDAERPEKPAVPES